MDILILSYRFQISNPVSILHKSIAGPLWARQLAWRADDGPL